MGRSFYSIMDYMGKFYQFLKRFILGKILCHGLTLDVGCGEGSFPKITVSYTHLTLPTN